MINEFAATGGRLNSTGDIDVNESIPTSLSSLFPTNNNNATPTTTKSVNSVKSQMQDASTGDDKVVKKEAAKPRPFIRNEQICVACRKKGNSAKNYSTGSLLDTYRLCFEDDSMEGGAICASCYSKCYAFRKKHNIKMKKSSTTSSSTSTPATKTKEKPVRREKTRSNKDEDKEVITACACCGRSGRHIYKFSSYESIYRELFPSVSDITDESLVCHTCYKKCHKLRQARESNTHEESSMDDLDNESSTHYGPSDDESEMNQTVEEPKPKKRKTYTYRLADERRALKRKKESITEDEVKFSNSVLHDKPDPQKVTVFFEMSPPDEEDNFVFRKSVLNNSKYSELLALGTDLAKKYTSYFSLTSLRVDRLVMLEKDRIGHEFEVRFMSDDCFDEDPIENKTRFVVYLSEK